MKTASQKYVKLADINKMTAKDFVLLIKNFNQIFSPQPFGAHKKTTGLRWFFARRKGAYY
ncbi:MAG: hypothetical protein B0W54_17205 [Cellvibrio sp. 79]|nr:MAG: hypothetical protein B0W54_17205 [Cellvibrio sp. 79]